MNTHVNYFIFFYHQECRICVSSTRASLVRWTFTKSTSVIPRTDIGLRTTCAGEEEFEENVSHHHMTLEMNSRILFQSFSSHLHHIFRFGLHKTFFLDFYSSKWITVWKSLWNSGKNLQCRLFNILHYILILMSWSLIIIAHYESGDKMKL